MVNSCGECLWKLLSIFGGRKKKENINPLLNTKNHDFVISVNIIEKILKKILDINNTNTLDISFFENKRIFINNFKTTARFYNYLHMNI